MFLLCYAQVYGAFGRTALLQTLEDDLASCCLRSRSPPGSRSCPAVADSA